MKLNILLLAFTSLFVFNSCKKKATSAKVSLHFNHVCGNQQINVGSGEYYTTGFGQKIQPNLLKYYVYNATLVNSSSGQQAATNVDVFRIIDASDNTRLSLDMGDIPNGSYDRLVFHIGVPYERNHSGAQTGDLDPAMGMIWTWTTGYIFSKVEGKYIDNTNQEKLFSNHFATDSAFTEVSIPVNVKIEGKTAHVNLQYNLAELYKNIDLNLDAFKHSDLSNDMKWISSTRDNFKSTFTFLNTSFDE